MVRNFSSLGMCCQVLIQMWECRLMVLLSKTSIKYFNDEMRCAVSNRNSFRCVYVCVFFCLLVTLSAAQTCSNVILSSTFLAQDFDVMWIEFSLWPNGCCAESDGFIFIWHFSNFGLVFMSWVYVDLVAANSLFRK